jgi:3',5'-cyclic AMP phosphodiesterase CpdA
MRIAVIGDLHVLDPASHGLTPGTARPPAEVGAAGDADRYHTFTERVLPSLLGEVAATRPDLVVHTGDLAETGNREPAGPRELRTGLGLLQGIGAPLLNPSMV